MKLIDIDKRQRIDVESPHPERKGLTHLLNKNQPNLSL